MTDNEQKNDLNSFTFFRNYYESIKNLSKKDQGIVLISILDFMFFDKKPSFLESKKNLKTFWILIEPILIVSKNRGKNAKKQGFVKNQNEIKLKSNQNQNEINHLLEIEEEVEKEVYKNNENQTHYDLDFIITLGTELGIDEKYCKKFFDYYDDLGWITSSGKKITNVKPLLKKWYTEDKNKNNGEDTLVQIEEGVFKLL